MHFSDPAASGNSRGSQGTPGDPQEIPGDPPRPQGFLEVRGHGRGGAPRRRAPETNVQIDKEAEHKHKRPTRTTAHSKKHEKADLGGVTIWGRSFTL